MPGNANLLTDIYLKSQNILRHTLSRLLTRHQDVEDVMQEAFVRSYAAARENPIKFPRTFLVKVARNLALNELAKASHRITSYIDDGHSKDLASSEVSAEENVSDREEFSYFCDAVSQLPEQCKKVFIMRKVYGVSQKEIAEKLGISVSTVEKHVISGLMKCRSYMRKVGYNTDSFEAVQVQRYLDKKKNAR